MQNITVIIVRKGLQLITFVSFLVVHEPLSAQSIIEDIDFDTTQNYRVELMDGTVIVGRYLEHSSTVLSLKTASLPRIDLPANTIKIIEVIEPTRMRNGEYWFPNPNYSRYFFAPNAIPLKKGDRYYQNAYVVYNSFNFGLSNNLSIGLGVELASTFQGFPTWTITSKLGYEVDKNLYVGAGYLFVGLAGDYVLNVVSGLTTVGDTDQNITAGLGWGFIEGDFSSRPILTLSGTTRVRRRMSLVTENWFFPNAPNEYSGLFSYGIRFFGETAALDLGFFKNQYTSTLGIPYIDFVINY